MKIFNPTNNSLQLFFCFVVPPFVEAVNTASFTTDHCTDWTDPRSKHHVRLQQSAIAITTPPPMDRAAIAAPQPQRSKNGSSSRMSSFTIYVCTYEGRFPPRNPGKKKKYTYRYTIERCSRCICHYLFTACVSLQYIRSFFIYLFVYLYS